MQTDSTRTHTVDQLNSFLRGELSAAETYRQALEKLPQSRHRLTFEHCARSHQERAELLSREVRRLGGEPSTTSGAWGTFAKLVATSARAFGETAAIKALEEGEDHGRDDYQRDLNNLELDSRTLIVQKVLPEQLRTHGAISTIKMALD
jgi:uncharacterized protein (TIGR02284 family)